jgi:hypothetical protein
MANDLRRCGYRRYDVFRIYGFNVMLLAVNAWGALKSVGQAIGGQKTAFARTPKVRDRTIAPLGFVAVPFLIAGWSAITLATDIVDQSYLHAAFAGVNAVLALYVMLSLHGVRNSIVDVVYDVRERLYRPERREAPAPAAPDWVTVLYHGTAASGETLESSAIAEALAAIDQEHAEEREIMLATDGSALGAVDDELVLDPESSDAGTPLAARDAAALASALSESLLQLRPGGTLVVRLGEVGVEIGLAGEDESGPLAPDARNGAPALGRS